MFSSNHIAKLHNYRYFMKKWTYLSIEWSGDKRMYLQQKLFEIA